MRLYLTYGFTSSFKGVCRRFSTSADILLFATLNRGWLDSGWEEMTVEVGVDATNSDWFFLESTVVLDLSEIPSLFLISANLLIRTLMCCCY